MTEEQVIEMEETLLGEMKKASFQNALHEAWTKNAGDMMAQMKARQEITLPIQIPVITKYGFEGTRKGLAQSTAAVGKVPVTSDRMRNNHEALMWLCDPDEQK